MPANSPIYLPYDDYAQSANTLFHFMKKQEYLNSVYKSYAKMSSQMTMHLT